MPNSLTATEWNDILIFHNYSCAYCKKPFTVDLPATQDHVIPVSKGGTHTKGNVVPCCRECNSSKGDGKWPKSLLKQTKSHQT
ncbi:MAG: HNH endonuclease [Deltaproteobacteria bacterium]|nr:HNH endonuclease [Deltaproteobacteria bacterium]